MIKIGSDRTISIPVQDFPPMQRSSLAAERNAMGGHVDLQVNGYGGIDFNADAISDADWIAACHHLRRDGCDRVLATIITADVNTMVRRIARVAIAMETLPDVASMVAGIHIEGPFINAADGYVGAHPSDAVVPASVDVADRLLDAGRGRVKLLTLAPEQDESCTVTRFLVSRSIVVAGGHSDASRGQLCRCIDAGMTLFTHLGNGCPALMPRHDNIVQRVLSLSDQLYVSLIADGHHVPFFVMQNYLQCIPDDRIVIVSDAISAAGLGPGTFSLGDQSVEVTPDGAAWAVGLRHFAGCATPVQQMVTRLSENLGVSSRRLDQWTRINPARVLGIPAGDDETG